MIGRMIAQSCKFFRLQFVYGQQEKRLQDWIEASQIGINNLPTAEGLMVVLNVRTDDDEVDRHAKMLAVSLELERQRTFVLNEFDGFARAANERLQELTDERDGWQKSAEALTNQLREIQLELDKLRARGS